MKLKLLEQGWLFERDGYLFDFPTWKETGMKKFDVMKNMKSRLGKLQSNSRDMQPHLYFINHSWLKLENIKSS